MVSRRLGDCPPPPGEAGISSMSMPRPTFAILFVFLVLSIAFDVRARRIPNALSAPGAVIGLVLHAVHSGAPGVVAGVVGAGLMIGLLIWPFAAGGIGGGDVKMMGAVGAFLGPRLAVMGLLIGVILGGAIMIVHLARLGRLRDKLASLATMVTVAAGTRSVRPLVVRSDDEAMIALPYSVPLAVGTMAAVLAVGGVR
jgi:prepilin peptidase CpaA